MSGNEARLLLFFLAAFGSGGAAAKCLVREPPEAAAPAVHGDAGFFLSVGGDPEFYEESKLYTITLKGDKSQFVSKEFTEFLLVVETVEDPAAPKAKAIGGRSGSFQLLGDVLTRFSDHCTNTVTQTSSVAKTEVQVLWRAPPAGSGCVVFKAVVVQSREVWAMDGGRLSLALCEAMVEEHSKQDAMTEPCCACEEAKYEVTFEGLWSKEFHPKSFPTNKWLLHFSDLIGASHSADYRVWEYGGFASKGLEHVAKWGSPRVLESELKAKSNHIRTIIKARGLWYPNVNGKTFAVFRTDKRNHLVSLVSMLGPSPDWIVGVSGLELCLPNCTWVEGKELFLYPWDAGVNDGISYESPDSPSDPRMPITRITSSHPDDPRQPFWNATGAPMKPLAKLTVMRQRLYAKACGDDWVAFERPQRLEGFGGAIEEGDSSASECEVTPWSRWSQCSTTCGKGVSTRMRSYSMPNKASCRRKLTQREMCGSGETTCPGHASSDSIVDDFHSNDVCTASEWSKWSECSTTCGKGFASRTRRFFNRMGRKKCPHVETMEKRMCSGHVNECPSHEGVEQEKNPHCAVTSWSQWSPCSVSCGRGLKVRTRLYMVSPQHQSSAACNVQLMEKANCEGPRPECRFNPEDARVICGLEKEMGPCRGYFPRWHFNPNTKMCLQFIYGGCRGNSNNFDRYEDCMKLCEIPHATGRLGSRPPEGVEEDVEEALDMEGIKRKMMELQRLSGGGGASNVYESRERRRQRLMDEERSWQVAKMKRRLAYGGPATVHPPVDCMVTAWSPWSGCSASCAGRSAAAAAAFREKFRMVKRHDAGGGKKCPKKLRRRQKCRLPPCQSGCGAVGEWGRWSECSSSCGSDGVQERVRRVEGEQPCGTKSERRICALADCP